MFHQRLGILVEALRELYFAPQNVLIDAHWVIIIKGVNTGVHLINKDSKGPPINGFTMSLVEDNLRSDVFRCTADSECSSLIEDLCKTKIGEFEITVIAYE
jgi:hypothetical protein